MPSAPVKNITNDNGDKYVTFFAVADSILVLVLRFLQGIMSRLGGSIYIKDNTIDKLASARIPQIWCHHKF